MVGGCQDVDVVEHLVKAMTGNTINCTLDFLPYASLGDFPSALLLQGSACLAGFQGYFCLTDLVAVSNTERIL